MTTNVTVKASQIAKQNLNAEHRGCIALNAR